MSQQGYDINKATVVAVPAVRVSVESDDRQPPGKCCGCCCDYRRATIIVNIILLILEVLVLVYLTVYRNYTSVVYSTSDEDFYDALDDYVLIGIILSAVSIVGNLIAIVGALKFNAWAVGIASLWLIGDYVAGIINVVNLCNAWNAQEDLTVEYGECTIFSINPIWAAIDIVIVLLFLYPHIGFVVDVKKGRLSRETDQPSETNTYEQADV